MMTHQKEAADELFVLYVTTLVLPFAAVCRNFDTKRTKGLSQSNHSILGSINNPSEVFSELFLDSC